MIGLAIFGAHSQLLAKPRQVVLIAASNLRGVPFGILEVSQTLVGCAVVAANLLSAATSIPGGQFSRARQNLLNQSDAGSPEMSLKPQWTLRSLRDLVPEGFPQFRD